VVAVAVLAGVARSGAVDSPPGVIHLGAIYNLSGAQAGLDNPSAKGAELAAAQLNAAGGVRGQRLELTIADGRSDPAEIRRQALRLLADGAVALLGLSDTDMVLPAATEAAKAGRVFLTSGATSPLLPEQVPTYLFLACFTDDAQGAAAAQFARSRLDAERAAVLTDGGMDFTKLVGSAFAVAFTTTGGDRPIDLEFPHGAADLAARLRARLGTDAPPDVLYLAAGPDDAPALLRSLRDGGFAQTVVGGDSFDTVRLAAAAAAPGRVYFTTHAFLEGPASSPAARAFAAAYAARYDQQPTAFSALGYDAVGLLADAIRRAQADDAAAVRAALAATRDYPGITGTISYGADRRTPRKPVYVVALHDGQRTLAADIVPEVASPAAH
jgi:branched-chain amino acid transport system substrate-binding protein